MSDPLADLFKTKNLHALKSASYHMLASAQEKGEDTAKPLAFVGLATTAIGLVMLGKAFAQMERGKADSRSR